METYIGTTGAALILLAFVMLKAHKWKEEYLIYDLANLLGSGLLVTYAVLLSSIPFAVLNGVWALVALHSTWGSFQENRKKKAKGFMEKWLK